MKTASYHNVPMADWPKLLNQMVTVVGTAANAKLGALLLTEDGDIWIDGLDAWPEGYYLGGRNGKRLRVTGTVIERDDLPVFEEGAFKKPAAGMPIPPSRDDVQASKRVLLANATWEEVH